MAEEVAEQRKRQITPAGTPRQTPARRLQSRHLQVISAQPLYICTRSAAGEPCPRPEPTRSSALLSEHAAWAAEGHPPMAAPPIRLQAPRQWSVTTARSLEVGLLGSVKMQDDV